MRHFGWYSEDVNTDAGASLAGQYGDCLDYWGRVSPTGGINPATGLKMSYRELLAEPTVDENGTLVSNSGGIRVVGIIAIVLLVVYIVSLNK
jgi:hypothetical protein